MGHRYGQRSRLRQPGEWYSQRNKFGARMLHANVQRRWCVNPSGRSRSTPDQEFLHALQHQLAALVEHGAASVTTPVERPGTSSVTSSAG